MEGVHGKLINEENEWDHGISAEVKEGPADCIRIRDVAAALRKMKRHKAPGLSGLTAEMVQATEGIGTQWLLDLCNGVVREGHIPEDWKSIVILPIYKGEGDRMECGSCRGIKLLEHAMKVVERIFESRIRQQIIIIIIIIRKFVMCTCSPALSMNRRLGQSLGGLTECVNCL